MAKTRSIEDRAAIRSDLESRICDVADMATVVSVLMERYQREAKVLETLDLSAESARSELDTVAAPLTFCVYHLNGMARRLKAEYYGKPSCA